MHIGEERLEAGTILWAAGVQASPLSATLGVPLDRAGRVKVQPDLSVPGAPSIFVVGDLATLEGPGGRPLPGVAAVAIQEAKHAVGAIAADRPVAWQSARSWALPPRRRTSQGSPAPGGVDA